MTKIFNKIIECLQKRKHKCGNCGNIMRIKGQNDVLCCCAIDGHYIGYLEFFEDTCKDWKREKAIK